ncbi:unnamed protein product [Paramecium octaurelia]|uniref:Uncharacterized protein n=1 Tax=Paramecium octaurelia TaxID=43137 RepID=A0A8S1V8I4_PAROT|nr:unnamed protein product [Paramecium octaurelia]
MSKDLVNLKGNSVQLKMDMPIEQFRYFTSIIQNNIINEWITTKKVDKIKEKLQQFISNTYQSEYIIIIAVKPAYNLSHKKNRYLMIKIEDITIFIYQAKPVDYFQFSQIKQIQNKLQGVAKDNHVSEPILVSQKNISEEEMESLQKVKQCINDIIILDYENWETDLVVAAKGKLHQLFQTGFWHIFCAKRITTMVDSKTNERYLEYQFDKKNSQYKLIAFQKKGPNFNLLEKVKLKVREIISFTVLFIFFVTLTTCKDETSGKQYKYQIQEQFCSHRQEVIGFCAIVLFGLVAQRMIGKRNQKKNKKQ